MRVLRLVLATSFAAVAATGTAAAAPGYSQPLDRYTLGKAKLEVGELATAEGISAETAELLLKLDVFATSSDTGCPGVDVDVVNATTRTVWNVEIVVEQKDGSNKRSETLHVPYMLADTKLRVSVSCLQDYTYRSRYDYGGNTPISLSYSARGSKTIDEALPLMIAQKRDYSMDGTSSIKPSATDSTSNLLEDALAMDDAAVAKELVLGIARTGEGRAELGEALADNGDGALADAVATSMKKLPPAQQAQIARTLLASKAAGRWVEELTPMIDRQLCTGARADVIGLWIQAQGETGIPVEGYRDRIREKCKPTKSDGPGLIAALEKDPTNAGPVLDAVDEPLFASAIAAWKARKEKSLMPTSMGAFLRGTQSAERFDQATVSIPGAVYTVAMGAVSQSPEGAAGAHKAEWLTKAMSVVDKNDHALVVTQLTEQLVGGEVPAAAIRDAIKGLAKLAPEAAETVIVTFANQSSKMFDATKLQAAGIDISEFLAFNASLGDCTAAIHTLADCAEKIAKYSDKSGAGVLVKLARTAVRNEFVAAMSAIVKPMRETAGLIDISTKLAAAGFDVAFVADRACQDARDAVRWGSDPDGHLELVSKIAPNAPCIAEVGDAAASKKRKGIMMAIFAIMGLVVPLPAGGLLMRRRWRKLQKQLPGEVIEETVTGAKLDDRLGARGLGRLLRDGVGEGKRELAGTAAGRAMETIDDALLAAATTTVARAVKSGDAATLIVRRASDAVYIVALPVRHPRPQVVQRYLGAPWPEHLAQIQRAAGTPVLALVVLCGPDAAEASVVAGYTDGATSSDPEVLLDAKDARDRGANRFRYVMTLAATPATTTTEPAKAA